MSKEIIYVFLGGGTGSMLRYMIQQLLQTHLLVTPFPWSTFAVNIIGSFLIGLFYGLSSLFNLSPEIRLLLTTGFCGGFTTFSTFSNDGLLLLKQGHYITWMFYLILSIVLGLVAVYLGSFFAENAIFSRK